MPRAGRRHETYRSYRSYKSHESHESRPRRSRRPLRRCGSPDTAGPSRCRNCRRRSPVSDDLLLEGNGRLDAADHEFAEGALHAGDGTGAGRGGDDQLGNHRVVVRRHRVAGIDVGIDPHALAAGSVPQRNGPRAGQEVGERILGVDTAPSRGHAIECRINAEDPFPRLASPGAIDLWYAPAARACASIPMSIPATPCRRL